jgi:predicted ABC-type ATPase
VARPVILVLAGVDGAGKSSVGGHRLAQAGLGWFNPDTFARELMGNTGGNQGTANAAAWTEGMRRLDVAISAGESYAFETTLGGRTVAAKLLAATRTHDVVVWFCGLASPEQHIERVRARVAAGGHPIAEAKIRERYDSSRLNLVALLPHLAQVMIYDNSVQAAPGEAVPDPVLVAKVVAGRLAWPADAEALARTPDWAKPLLAAALANFE